MASINSHSELKTALNVLGPQGLAIEPVNRGTLHHKATNYDPCIGDHCDGPSFSIMEPINSVGLICISKIDFNPYLTWWIKINSRWVTDLAMRSKTISLLKK